MHKAQTIVINGKIMSFEHPKIMGILNVTPDSFFDGGKHTIWAHVERQVADMVFSGMDILDIGGYSSRPGADEISIEEELDRVIPVIENVKRHFPEIPISIDTFRSSVAKESVKAGASLINDISGGTDDALMLQTVAQLQVPYILMHKQGRPKDMQEKPHYKDVVLEVHHYFVERLNACQKAGIHDVVLDPGFGFGKTVEHNYALLGAMKSFEFYGKPLLAGLSRKSMINQVLNTTPETALNGTTVLNTIALTNGADLLRVHDVKEAKQVVQLFQMLS